MLCHTVMVAMATCLIYSSVVQSQFVQDEGVCGESKGCFSIPPGCDTADPANSCTAFSSWSLGEDGLILFNLVAGADGYIAIGLSKSGGMDDSEVYACTSNRAVVRSRNDVRSNIPLELKGVSDQSVTFENGVLSCTFKREQSVAGDSDFFDLQTENEYTPLLAWGASLTSDGHVTRHAEREVGSGPTDFTENIAAGVGSSVSALQKLHGIFMVLAWLGFASIGITTARFFKKSLPGKLCGKPSWFAVHRFCMVSVVTLAVIAYIVIIIHVGGYIKPEEGTIRFMHAILGTIVMALGPINVIMALFRPHPGEPWRNLFNWCHWGVGMSALLLGGVTILLGTSNRPGQEGGVLLQSVPQFVFPIAIALVFFHLAVWVLLTVIDLLQKKAVTEIPMEDKAGPNATSASTAGLAEQEPPNEPIIKLILYGVYVTVVLVGVMVIVLAVGIGKKM
ncbi:ferric-chelate reductase 1-like [Apostichopus japonicus]|uniref:ferric-chelate reductase 1-like n=1 Tax=Stichopus japonicus TaxID=307972 RepID=UPI003AB2B4C5